jgi:ABC-type uncharacterized transport system permease subunit
MIYTLILSSLIYTTPLLLAAIGGYYSERAGLVNIALEGEMLIGAFAAIAGAWWTGSLVCGLIFAMLSGVIIGFLHGFITSILKCNHIISGMGINLLAIGLTGVSVSFVFGRSGSTPSVKTLPAGPAGIPWLLFIGIIFVLLTSYWSKFSTSGLRHRAAGESISAAVTAGINYRTIRIKGSIITGVLCSLAGAQQSLGELGSFVDRITAGRGFIALGALILARWRPLPVIFTSFLFGFTSALSETLEALFPSLPSDIILMFPFVATLLVLAGFISEIKIPRDLGRIVES